jgi:hypothetical protein
VALLAGSPAIAYGIDLHEGSRAQLSLDFDLSYGAFRSDRAYAQTDLSDGNRTWTEGYADIALNGSLGAWQDSRWYGSLGTLSTATWGDGDAAGYTTGRERRTALEDAYLGWRSGSLFPAFGKDGVDVSFGRRSFMLGDGFLIDGDALNFGKGFDDLVDAGIAPESFDRGGAYWLGRRHAFDRIALVRVGIGTKLDTTLFWIRSDNEAQAETEIAGADVVYTSDAYGSLAVAYIRGLSVDERLAEFLGFTDRDGQDTFNLRYDGSALIESLTLMGEYVYQDNGTRGNDWAWYGEVAWKFTGARWAPRAGVRYSAFSQNFDPLFYGFSTGYGTWFQGEVAGNYAGPFNSNAAITHLHVRGYPNKRWTLGALFYDFRTDDKDAGNLDGMELDLFFTWTKNERITVSSLLGVYKPDEFVVDGGTQLGDDDTNLYMQFVVQLTF